MNYDLNLIIKRKRFNNFIQNGDVFMDYRISKKMSDEAKRLIENDELCEELNILKNQISFLDDGDEYKKVFNENEVNNAKENLLKINEMLGSLAFKKQNLETVLDDKLSKLDIDFSVKIKEELNKINNELNNIKAKEKEMNSIITNDRFDYDNQMFKIKEKYDGVDILKHDIVDDYFSENVIKDYKKDRASKLVVQFLNSLSEDKKQQVLNDNENLKGYLNVGENF